MIDTEVVHKNRFISKMFLKGDSVILIIKLRPETEGDGPDYNVMGSEDISRLTLGNATIGQLNEWQGETHPSCHGPTLHPDPRNIIGVVIDPQNLMMSARDKGREALPKPMMTMTLEESSLCINEPIPIGGPYQVIGEMGNTRFCTPILYPILYWTKTAGQYQYPIPIQYRISTQK